MLLGFEIKQNIIVAQQKKGFSNGFCFAQVQTVFVGQ
jgi:hypothetical protein